MIFFNRVSKTSEKRKKFNPSMVFWTACKKKISVPRSPYSCSLWSLQTPGTSKVGHRVYRSLKLRLVQEGYEIRVSGQNSSFFTFFSEFFSISKQWSPLTTYCLKSAAVTKYIGMLKTVIRLLLTRFHRLSSRCAFSWGFFFNASLKFKLFLLVKLWACKMFRIDFLQAGLCALGRLFLS